MVSLFLVSVTFRRHERGNSKSNRPPNQFAATHSRVDVIVHSSNRVPNRSERAWFIIVAHRLVWVCGYMCVCSSSVLKNVLSVSFSPRVFTSWLLSYLSPPRSVCTFFLFLFSLCWMIFVRFCCLSVSWMLVGFFDYRSAGSKPAGDDAWAVHVTLPRDENVRLE